jgi:DNA repair photolyase
METYSEVDMNDEMKINGKALYTPKGAALEYAPVGCNIYTGCKHDCEYCYLKRGVLSHAMGGTDVKLKSCFKSEEHAIETFCREADRNLAYLQKAGVFFSFSTDPLIAETRAVTKACLVYANMRAIPVKLLTKNADFIDDDLFMSGLESADFRRLVAFGFTLTGRDDMEPGASTNEKRIETMKRLKAKGFHTFASIEPIIDFGNSFAMIEQAAMFCDLFKIGLRSGVKDNYYDANKCAFFIGQITSLCETIGFKVYWKQSIYKYIQRHMASDHFDIALSLSKNFVDMDYNIFKEGRV